MATITGTSGDDRGDNILWGTRFSDIIRGLAGDDILVGDDGNDTLEGGDGTDFIYGDEGFDVIRGGSGYDVVYYSFDPAAVTIDLEQRYAIDGWKDRDTLDQIEEIVGSEFHDQILGDSNNNSFVGNKGNDTLDGRDGDDRVNYHLAEAGVLVNLTQGFAQDGNGGRDILRSIEEVFGSEFNDTIIGNDSDNFFWGDIGDDQLFGKGGDDYFTNYIGSEVFDGGSGEDTINFHFSPSALKVDLAENRAYSENGDIDTIHSVEVIMSSQFGDTLLGSTSDDMFFGKDGNDVITGGKGDDTLYGEKGNDRLEGNAGDDALYYESGNDTLLGGDGDDFLLFLPSEFSIELDVTMERVILANGDTSIIRGFESFIGSSSNDTFIGDDLRNNFFGDEGNDTLTGNGGDDYLSGGPGSDLVVGGAGTDAISFSGVPNPIRLDIKKGQAVATNGDVDVFRGIERYIGSEHNDTMTGSGDANDLFGDDGDDFLDGRAGNDTLLGGNGEDTLFGGRGDDRLFVSAGSDEIDGGFGRDELVFSRYLREIEAGTFSGEVNLRTGTATATSADGSEVLTWSITSIEDVLATRTDTPGEVLSMQVDLSIIGNSVENHLVGGTGDDTLMGAKGGDHLEGREGQDIASGGRGADTLDGGLGRDTLSGDEGNDHLLGGAGTDQLTGGAGRDRLIGGDGADRFHFSGRWGKDTVVDFDRKKKGELLVISGEDEATNLRTFKAASIQMGSDVVYDAQNDGRNVIVLEDVSLDALRGNDFDFV